MAQFKIPEKSSLTDKQTVQVSGPDGVVTTYQFDSETCTLYSQASPVIIPPFHGQTHIAEDAVPIVTTDTQGHMSPSDKAKLDAITQTRVGVLGFAGSGLPDDGGFLQGDIILATGSDLLNIERVGNVVRFTLNTTQQFCGCEECAQIFWIQDESDPAQIRPPSCAGKLPGTNVYNEMKVYLLPENTILDPSNPVPTLNQKSFFPAMTFTRFPGLTPDLAQFHLVLQRNTNTTTRVGWSMTPGTSGKVETIWWTGLDDDGEQITFELEPNSESNLLGMLLYKGHSLTRQMAVVTSYTSTILSTNQYLCRFWDVNNAGPVGDEFTATNVWQYNNPTNSATSLVNPRTLVLDSSVNLLPVGTLVQIWEYQIGEINGERLVRRFFNLEPQLSPETIWTLGGAIKFGDLLTARREVSPMDPSEKVAFEEEVSDIRLIERSEWGITGFEDPLLLSDDGEGTDTTVGVLQTDALTAFSLVKDTDFAVPNLTLTGNGPTGGPIAGALVGRTLVFSSGAHIGEQFEILFNSEVDYVIFGEAPDLVIGDTFFVISEVPTSEPSGIPINNQFVANIDPDLPGLRVETSDPSCDSERPVYIWHRGNHKNLYVKALVGMPSSSTFPPMDILLRAPGDSYDDTYLNVIRRGILTTGRFAGRNYIIVKGVHWKDLPPEGTLRILTGLARNEIWTYFDKVAFYLADDDAVQLIGDALVPFLFDEDFEAGTAAPDITQGLVTTPGSTTVAELLHEDYNAAALRLEFSVNDNSEGESVQLQVRGGLLDMAEPYEFDRSVDPVDEYVRGFQPGNFAVSALMTQQGFIDIGTETPEAEPVGFKVYRGGFSAGTAEEPSEFWNTLEIMYRDDQLWVWWNNLLVPPDPTLSAQLPTPVAVTTPYFQIQSPISLGKVVLRLWPGTTFREMEIRDQALAFNEFVHGQLELST